MTISIFLRVLIRFVSRHTLSFTHQSIYLSFPSTLSSLPLYLSRYLSPASLALQQRVVSLKLFYYDDVTPEDYQPQYFSDATHGELRSGPASCSSCVICVACRHAICPYLVIGV